MHKKRIKSVLLITLLLGYTALSNSQTQNINPGKFENTDSSLQNYQYPDWFRDAKFGIWSHWGPQAVPRQGDWYARKLYMQDSPNEWEKGIYEYHLKTYGHPSQFGYKDIIPLWKAERWNPDQLMKLYKKTGAKYFVSMAVHHDNFFLWNSKIHSWNSVNMGPKKDIVGLWQKAAQKQGLPFGVSEHLAASYTWFQVAHNADKTGPLKNIPYDGNNPDYAELYHTKAADNDKGWMTINPIWQQQWYERIKELVDTYKPDLLYSDSPLPFHNDIGRSAIANLYNTKNTNDRSKRMPVYNCKEPSKGRFVQDVERGVMDSISNYPWQTDTSIGDWYYKEGQKYTTSKQVIQMLIDIVSKNGNLLLNVVQTPEGDLENDVLKILTEIGEWLEVNGEGIYGTRPWKTYGEGPSTTEKQEKGHFGGIKDTRDYKAGDIRYTQKDNIVYAFLMENCNNDLILEKLGKRHLNSTSKIIKIQKLGSNSKISFEHNNNELKIKNIAKQQYTTVNCYKIFLSN